ncbi:MAG: hypothetical protein ABSE68_00830 [Minisyncoccia bacterium]
MANENFFPGQIPGQPLGTGEGESPLAKTVVPNTDVRTMASDIQSINTGSSAPKPYAPQTSAPENLPIAPVSSLPGQGQSFQIPQTDTAPGQIQEPPAPKKGSGKLFMILISVIAIAGLAALGYFVVYPIFFAAPVETTLPTGQDVVLPPTTNEPVTPAPEATTTVPPAVSEPNPPAPSHVSPFSIPADATIEAASTVTGAALSGLNINSLSSPNITEIVYRGSDGNFIGFASFLKAMTGADLSNTPIETAFVDQGASGLVYTDASGTRWLGLIAPLKNGETTETDASLFKSAFEKSTGYNNLFAGDPGAPKAWKSSAVTGLTDHKYLLFANSGFAIDYGWVGNKVIIMTSFDGLKEAIKRI